ncbi:hypothetical protein MASR2M78_30210 [Treponema sp.]
MQQNMIGSYGPWATSLLGEGPGSLSFRNNKFNDVEAWRAEATSRFLELLAQSDTGSTPLVSVLDSAIEDDLEIQLLSWRLPYGPPTEALFLKPKGARGKLPGALALHDHAGNKYFGWQKITKFKTPHPLMVEHQNQYYSGRAWANELARRGYAVLVPDTFPFASRRVLPSDYPADQVPPLLRDTHGEEKADSIAYITAYNAWAAEHESIMAKALFCAGTTWPGVFLAEDRVALDILCNRDDVDAERGISCCGLSGGGMRTNFLAGIDPRISCAVSVGMLSTWRDFLLHKAWTHTWMIYVPQLPRYFDYAEILGLRVPLPSLVLNNRHDELFTLSEMERGSSMLADMYKKAGASDNFQASFHDGPHKFDS